MKKLGVLFPVIAIISVAVMIVWGSAAALWQFWLS